MSGPVPSPSMYGMTGSSGTTSWLFSYPMRVPEGGVCIVRRKIQKTSRRSRGASQKRSQLLQVLPVGLVLDRLRRLDYFRDAPEARVADDVAEGVDAEVAFADVLVAVDARAERPFR